MISLTSPIETRAHAWPAGVKLLGLCLATMVLFSQNGIVFHACAFLCIAATYASAGLVFLRYGAARLWGLWPFVVMVLIWHAVTQDFVAGLVISIRLLSAVALANLVTLTTKLSAMIDVVRFLATPLRRIGLKTQQLELGIALVVRFTPVLAHKGSQLSDAWRARSPKRAKWNIVVPLAVLAIDDAEYLAEALKARGGVD
ncbi:biotin transport system permease protein [Pacificibacter maritimus]|uniref:Biotin transport system permease protein n=1 Tax=Pacificibacter maritimus TaxID=762213 RepID=A0A3N4URL8_9RHOB|nr:energy-coupling factor transporter transmembrane component T [Pacificibacter maritimus]RPE63334.1 biotin transport system permease protein [Pacificibacter maritimus]